ncbi:MAG: alpha/beta fold hydrolase [Clostridia bacterium]|nr:alpha/beta fold hydrolase [Clostridia bacterium]
MKLFVKSLSLLLSFLTLLASFIIVSFAEENKASIPTVYIAGQGYGLWADKNDRSSEKIYGLNVETDYIIQKAKEVTPIFLKAYITDDYTEYADFLYDAVQPIYEPIQLGKDGEPHNESGNTWNWSRETLRDEKIDGEYDLFAYNVEYDWRIDPCETADMLSRYIDDVLYVTGSDKVNLVSRCLGCNIVAAYLYEYGHEKVNKLVLYCSTLEGMAVSDKVFSGNMELDPDAVERYVYDLCADSGRSTVMQLIEASVALLNKTNGLDLATDFINHVYRKARESVQPRIEKTTYATFPAYWSTIGADYEKAKEFIFGSDIEEYAELIEKIDHYHYNIQINIKEMLSEIAEDGVGIAIISKYGYQTVPVVSNSYETSDRFVELHLSSFGATTADVGKTLDKTYLNAAEHFGTLKYISPDKVVDASTCLFPDSTWIIKGLEHTIFPSCVNELIMTFLRTPGQMTVNDYEQFPQYMIYKNDQISPMNDENCGITNWENNNLFKTIINFANALSAFIKEYLPAILNK